jgi:opacity protein-like surface antigen
MRNSLSIIAAALLCALAAAAQDTPRVETFVGYTYQRANSATDVPAFSMNGGSGQVAVNFNKWIGFVMDMGAVHNGNVSGLHIDNTLSNYLFGPRVSLRYSRIRPYFQTLFGGAHFGTSVRASLVEPPGIPTQPIFIPGEGNVPVGPGQPVTARLVHSQTAFGMTVGGGLDIKINKWVSFRPVGLDYYLTRLQNMRSANDNNQHHLRYTTGFNFTFGAQ